LAEDGGREEDEEDIFVGGVWGCWRASLGPVGAVRSFLQCLSLGNGNNQSKSNAERKQPSSWGDARRGSCKRSRHHNTNRHFSVSGIRQATHYDIIRFLTSSNQSRRKREIPVFFLSTPHMPWPFCPQCKATLSVDSSGDIKCPVCAYHSNLADIEVPSVTTYSARRPPPLWAQTKKTVHKPVRATIDEPCPQCQAPQVGYYTVQLRSVDEGQTVFYECAACQYTWSVHN